MKKIRKKPLSKNQLQKASGGCQSDTPKDHIHVEAEPLTPMYSNDSIIPIGGAASAADIYLPPKKQPRS